MTVRKPSNSSRSRVTVWEVSELSGYSISTVSNVLNSPEIVAEETRIKVLSAIKELGYKPHAAARNLKSRKSHSIGFPIYKSGVASVMGEFFRELVELADDQGFGITTFTVDENNYKQSFQKLLDRDAVDGFMIAEVVDDDPRIAWLAENNINFVAWGRTNSPASYRWVDLDCTLGMDELTQHVVEQGHSQVAYVGWNGEPTNRFRREGVIRGLAQHGLRLSKSRQLVVDFSVEGGEAAAERLLRGKNQPNAIICGHDIIAAGVIRKAKQLGHHIGKAHLIVTGSDDTPVSLSTDPTITSIHFPLAEVARRLLDLFLTNEPQENSLVAPKLIIRESSN